MGNPDEWRYPITDETEPWLEAPDEPDEWRGSMDEPD